MNASLTFLVDRATRAVVPGTQRTSRAASNARVQLPVLHHGVRWAARSCQRLAGLGRSEGSRHKWAEHDACRKWLLFWTELSAAAVGSRARRDAPNPVDGTKSW